MRVAISVWHGLSLSRTASPVRAASDSRLGVGALYALLKVGWYTSSTSESKLPYMYIYNMLLIFVYKDVLPIERRVKVPL